MPDKRQTPRIEPFVACCWILHGSRRLSGYLTDLSSRGARISCAEEPPGTGESVTLEVRFGRSVTRSHVPAEVKWTRPRSKGGAYVFGLTFARISQEEQRRVDSVVEEFRRRAELLVR